MFCAVSVTEKAALDHAELVHKPICSGGTTQASRCKLSCRHLLRPYHAVKLSMGCLAPGVEMPSLRVTSRVAVGLCAPLEHTEGCRQLQRCWTERNRVQHAIAERAIVREHVRVVLVRPVQRRPSARRNGSAQAHGGAAHFLRRNALPWKFSKIRIRMNNSGT